MLLSVPVLCLNRKARRTQHQILNALPVGPPHPASTWLPGISPVLLVISDSATSIVM